MSREIRIRGSIVGGDAELNSVKIGDWQTLISGSRNWHGDGWTVKVPAGMDNGPWPITMRMNGSQFQIQQRWNDPMLTGVQNQIIVVGLKR